MSAIDFYHFHLASPAHLSLSSRSTIRLPDARPAIEFPRSDVAARGCRPTRALGKSSRAVEQALDLVNPMGFGHCAAHGVVAERDRGTGRGSNEAETRAAATASALVCGGIEGI